MRNTRKCLLPALAVLVVIVCAFSALAEEDPGENLGPNMVVVNCKEFVSLREEPSTKSARLIKVPLGAGVVAWLDGGSDDPDEEEFLYCEYNGLSGYILREYLAAIAEGYDTGLGFSFRYNPNRLTPDQTMSESGQSVLIEWFGWEDCGPAYLELMLPEAFHQDPMEYLEANADYIDTYTTDTGAVVTYGAKTSEDFMLAETFYIVTLEDQTVLAAATYPTEIAEIIEPDFQIVVNSIFFN